MTVRRFHDSRNSAGSGRVRALLAPAAGLAQTARDSDREAIRRAVDAGYEDSLRRLREWIALPTIAAEQRNVPEGAALMARLATEAGFTGVRTVPTGGVPAVFGMLNAGARRTVGIYFMYDVKQFDPRNGRLRRSNGIFSITRWAAPSAAAGRPTKRGRKPRSCRRSTPSAPPTSGCR